MSRVRLICFVQGGDEDRVKGVFGAHRITVSKSPDWPAWASRELGDAYEIQTLAGEYGGFVGAETAIGKSNEPDTIDRLRNKHPSWSSERLNRVAAEATSAKRRKPNLVSSVAKERDANLNATVTAIKEIAQTASLRVILVNEAEGPLAQPTTEKMRVDEISPDKLARFPWNCLVTIV
jgi:hypothetical protein